MKDFWQTLKRTKEPIFVLAPMDGVTDFVFREIISQTAKPDVFFTEFTNVDALLSKGYNKTITRLKYTENQRYIVAQIWGVNPDHFYKVAKLIKSLNFDGIDINMGCPDRKVMKIGSGAQLINNQTLAAQIIAATKAGAPTLPVSVKTRVKPDLDSTKTWFKLLLSQNLSAFTIHGRTDKELPESPVRWDFIEEAVKLRNGLTLETLIIGNGGIKDKNEALQKYKQHGLDGTMLGKAIFSNPWVFEKEHKEHSKQEHLHLLLKHTKLYSQTYQNQNFETMKKFFKIYVKTFYGADALKKQLMKTTNYREVEDLVKPHLSINS